MVSAQEKAELYAHADVFVFPSLYEGFGIPILEALSLGTPVVCSETSSMPEAGGAGALLIDPLDTEEIAQGIYTLLTDQDLRAAEDRSGASACRRVFLGGLGRQSFWRFTGR